MCVMLCVCPSVWVCIIGINIHLHACLSFSAYELTIGQEFQVASHNYPNSYPPNAYVLWTFRYAADMTYFISFGFVHLGFTDVLTVGSSWDTNNPFREVRGLFSGSPADVYYIPKGHMFIEFDADSYSQGSGFNLNIAVHNSSGKCLYLVVYT